MYSKNLIKGTLQPLILKLLQENEKMYGYEITQHVKKLTEGKIQLTEGALYPALHKLEAEGLLLAEKVFIGKRIRKYYSIAPKENNAISEKVDELSDFLSTLSKIIQPKTSS